MHRRITPIALCACLVAGMLALGGSPAQAARPFNVQQFMPNDTQENGACAAAAPGCTPDALSDKDDGIDSLAHLTVVTSQDAQYTIWYACPAGFPNAPTNADLATCNITIGTDSSGRTVPGDSDELAFDVTWDIPGNLDQQTRDIVALACIGTPPPTNPLDNPNPQCRASVEHAIFLEDAQTGNAQNTTSAGEFGNYRTLQSCLGSNAQSCEPSFELFPHGSLVPNDGFEFRAFTSFDVQTLWWQLNVADATQEPAAANFASSGPCTQEGSSHSTFKQWRCLLSDANVPDDEELALSLLDHNATKTQPQGSAGYCNASNNPTNAPSAQNSVPGAHDECVLDVHYILSTARQATSIVSSFTPHPPSPSANAGCSSPDTDESSQLGTTEGDVICMFDQFGDPIDAPWTLSTSGVGEILSCGGDGMGHDHNGDGTIDDCHGTTGPDGLSDGIVKGNPSGPTGDQVITECFDLENSTANPPVANHGCADATGALVKTETIHWATLPSEVFLAFDSPAPSNASDPCRTGATVKQNFVGDHDELTVCTFDSNGNPVPTDTNGFSLQWSIVGAQGQEPTAVQFDPTTPPQETSGASGQAKAGITAVHAGDNFVVVCLLDENGDVVMHGSQRECFSIEKQVVAKPITRNVPTNLTARKGRKFIRGKAKSSQSECQSGRSVTLFRRRKGPDDVVGSDSTNQFGRWGVTTGHRRGTYYARVAQSQATDAQTGDTLVCLADQSKDVRRGSSPTMGSR